jgi:hypothetical protein
MNIDAATTTRSGRSVSAPTYLNAYEVGNIQYEIKLTKAEEQFYAQMKELGELAFSAPNLLFLSVQALVEALSKPENSR